MIPVTKTFLPPIKEYNDILQRAWDKQWLTNRGELVKELEEKLKVYLKAPHTICTNNGTMPLQIALELFGKEGEVITTPFSYVATTSSIVWQHCTPVFVDIHPEYLTIDENLIEAAITTKTTSILATHVFGNPCAVESIETIAEKHHLKVIYDAAHAFGVQYKGKSIMDYGDVSTCSFHATKLFHTGEGGALFCKDKEIYDTLFYMHNFGHKGQEDFYGLGINAKMSELQAAMGLAVFPYLPSILKGRKRIVNTYKRNLKNSGLQFLKLREETDWNYSYFPVIFKDEKILLKVEAALEKEQIFPRRYFYPALNTLPYVKNQTCIHSSTISESILCLPLFYGFSEKEILRITEVIKENI